MVSQLSPVQYGAAHTATFCINIPREAASRRSGLLAKLAECASKACWQSTWPCRQSRLLYMWAAHLCADLQAAQRPAAILQREAARLGCILLHRVHAVQPTGDSMRHANRHSDVRLCIRELVRSSRSRGGWVPWPAGPAQHRKRGSPAAKGRPGGGGCALAVHVGAHAQVVRRLCRQRSQVGAVLCACRQAGRAVPRCHAPLDACLCWQLGAQ